MTHTQIIIFKNHTEKAPLPTEGEAAVLAALAPHERLYKQGQMRLVGVCVLYM